MKLQNLAVIFVIIAIPIILVLAYYMSLQSDTLNLQAAYNTKLLDSTKEAIDAFEINTVEWNANYSETADSKRRDVMASINTFTNAFANNTGVSGISKEYILAHMPAIAFTLYDGYYIYSPADVKETVQNTNGVTIIYNETLAKKNVSNNTYPRIEAGTYNEDNNNKVLYVPKDGATVGGYYKYKNSEDTIVSIPFTFDASEAKTDNKHILKPFTSYSEKIVSTVDGGNTEVIINYTLDNYVTLYGEMKDTDGEVRYVSRGGYLTDTAKITGIDSGTIKNIKFDGKDIEPEVLSEKIAYKNGDTIETGTFNYVYEAEGNTKVYIEGNTAPYSFFRINTNLERVDVESLSEPLYKKCTIPREIGGNKSYIELYQKLTKEDNKWYTINKKGEYVEATNTYRVEIYDVKCDFSAINYYVESYIFTKWFNDLELEVFNNSGTPEDTSDDFWDKSILQIGGDNNPDPESEIEKDSKFSNHKREVIKEVITSNLNQAITSYSRNSTAGDFYLPELTETDWDQILTNVSIITFMQDIPIGLKEYNHYAIATSTVNKEYVDTDEIYLYNEGLPDEDEYHMPYCDKLSGSSLIGYRSIDFMQKNYANGEEIKYYYKHSDDASQACYNCLVQRSLYKENSTNLKEKAYYTTLARERYVARMSKLPSEVEPSYFFRVIPIDKANTNKIFANEDYTALGNARYKIDGIDTVGESGNIKIEKREEVYSIDINAETSGVNVETSGKLLNRGDTGSLDTPKGTVKESENYSTYKSDSHAKLEINQYTENGLIFNISGNEVIYQLEQIGKQQPTDLTDSVVPCSFSYEDNGYIYFYLEYEKNYTTSGTPSLEAFANINNYGDLTLATKVNGISDKVVLKFVNPTTGEYYWSENIFDVNNGDIIYCRIGGEGANAETSWYEGDWEVYAYAVDYKTELASGVVDFYTIRTTQGLVGFSEAVNNSAKTKEREFYLIENIDGLNMNPIAQDKNNGEFNGLFTGGKDISGVDLVDIADYHSINNLKINVDNSKGNNYAFGLFGWIGNDGGMVNKLTINNIEVSHTGSNNVGGIAGNCATGTGISNITINGGTISGGTYTGGIVGKSERAIYDCSVNNINSITGKGDTGGIVGNTTNEISNCKVNTITTLSGTNTTGGIVGYTKNIVYNSEVNNVNKLASNGKTGGIAGKSESSKNENAIYNCSVKTVGTLEGKGDTGGIVGNIGKPIYNCNVDGVTTLSGIGSIGGIVGYTENTISDCTVNNITTLTGEGNVGGIVGNSISTGNAVSNCNVTNGTTLSGTGSVGGIAGYIKSSILNSNTSITNIWNAEFTKDKHYDLYIGGIAGYTTGQITGSSVVATNIGNGNVTMTKKSNEVTIVGLTIGGINKYCVGGIAGYTSGTINITEGTLNSDVKVTGGRVYISSSDDQKAFISAGGIVGYKNSSQEANNSWAIDCEVSGFDNVGGIIGYNKKGNITGISRSKIVSGSGENVGGIVGLNEGGSISNCTNNATIGGVSGNLAENVGGIVGCNYNKNITNCNNNTTVTGDRNVGGIAGIVHGGQVTSCKNNIGGNVTGQKNKNGLLDKANNWYSTGDSNCYGTGGIVGKSNGAKILYSANEAIVKCNYNGAGIAGLSQGGAIKYCYNSGEINSVEASDGTANRIGGITGATNGIEIIACYNTGVINGKSGLYVEAWAPLKTPVGGIVGFLVDDSFYFKTENYASKYLNIDFKVLGIGYSETNIYYSYNSGKVVGDYTAATNTTHYNGGIVGFIGIGNRGYGLASIESCYYLDTTSVRGTNDLTTNDKGNRRNEYELKQQLYNWSAKEQGSGGLLLSGKHIYNTTAPLEENLGYKGYGILWWQLDGYVKLTTNMFLCNKKTLKNGNVEYGYTNFKNTAYNQTITLINSENKEGEIAFNKNKFEVCRVEQSFNGKPVDNKVGCYRWIMMIPKGNYTIKGTTDFSDKSQFFNSNSLLYEGQEYNIGYISNDTTLYVAPILEVIEDKFDIKNIGAEWKRENTKIKRYGVYTKPDFIPRTIEVNAHYYKKPNNSSYTINNKTASVYLDKLETLSTTNNTTAYLDNYTYYTMGFGKMEGPYTKTGDTEKIRSNSAQCNVYLNVENLVDKLGEETARKNMLHSAEIKMSYRIKMWCEKGDFGSWWTNPAKLKNSTLEYNVKVQRKAKNSQQWVNVSTIKVPIEYKNQTSENGKIGDDGYYEFTYEIQGEDFSGSLAGLNYNDDIRIAVGLNFISKEGNCTFYIDDAELNITYGPNVKDV